MTGVPRREEVSSAQGGGAAPSRWSAVLRPALVFVVYLAGYMALDFATEGIKGSLDVSLWFPPVGLTFALLLVFGWRYAPAVAVAFLLHVILFRGGLDYPLTLLVALPIVYAVLYAGAAVLLERVLKIDPRFTSMRDVVWFVVVACLSAPLLVAAVTVWGFVLGRYTPASAFRDNLFGSWAGDATGIAVLTSFLLVASRPFDSLWMSRSPGPTREAAASFRWPSRRELPEVILQVVGLTVALVAAYAGARGASLDYAYLAFAPVIWVALRSGFERVTVALLLVNVGVVILVGETVEGVDAVLLQFGLMALTLVGLLFGALASDREEAQETLKESEERFRTIFEQGAVGISIVSLDKILLATNLAYQEMLGYSEEELYGSPLPRSPTRTTYRCTRS